MLLKNGLHHDKCVYKGPGKILELFSMTQIFLSVIVLSATTQSKNAQKNNHNK